MDLPHWRTLVVRFDIMHSEKFIFDNVFYTVIDVKGKTKDNVKAREDIRR